MDVEWVAIGLSEVLWIGLAFALGLLSRSVGLPPLVGFLAAGFVLGSQGISHGELLQKLADIGITLLLFTVGLKLNLRTLARPQVWAVSGGHLVLSVAGFAGLLVASASLQLPLVRDLNLNATLVIAFALSFSSTVFAVKVLEERGDVTSLHGRIAIGILLMQDIAAVAFLAFSFGKLPSAWAAALILLLPLRAVIHRALSAMGHGELLVLLGFLLALGGAEAFELVGLKGDLGALVLGILIAGHRRAEEMSKAMLGFKDLFLLGFFLSIGLSGAVTQQSFFLGAALTPLILIKATGFFVLLTRFNLRSRTSLLTAFKLANYSEFGLIVIAVGVANGWLASDWLVVLAIALSLSFAVAAALSSRSESIYRRWHAFLRRFQRSTLVPEDRALSLHGAKVAVIGMGTIGTGAYEALRARMGNAVVGVDIDPIAVEAHVSAGRRVVRGDAGDADFWERVESAHEIDMIMLALPKQSTTLAVLDNLRHTPIEGHVAVAARYPDEVVTYAQAGAASVFEIFAEAGAGFVAHVEQDLPDLRQLTDAAT